MASSQEFPGQKSLSENSPETLYTPKAEGLLSNMDSDHQEKVLLDFTEGTTVAYRKKGPQVLSLEHWNKEAILNDSSSIAITSFAMAFVAD